MASRRMLRYRRACVLWPWEWSDTVRAWWEGAGGLLAVQSGTVGACVCVWAGWLHQQQQLVQVLWGLVWFLSQQAEKPLSVDEFALALKHLSSLLWQGCCRCTADVIVQHKQGLCLVHQSSVRQHLAGCDPQSGFVCAVCYNRLVWWLFTVLLLQ